MSLRLRPMLVEEFDAYRARGTEDYARDVARTRMVGLEEARERADREWRDMLPQGVTTGR